MKEISPSALSTNRVEQFIAQFKKTEHLGDGAYIGFTGYDYCLFTTDGISISNEIYLDGLKTLKQFILDCEYKDE